MPTSDQHGTPFEVPRKFVFLYTSKIIIVILSHVNGGFHCRRHKQSQNQYVGLQRFDPNCFFYGRKVKQSRSPGASLLRNSFFLQIGDLHVVEVKLQLSSWRGLSLKSPRTATVTQGHFLDFELYRQSFLRK